MPDVCMANFGKSTALDDLCGDEGGQTIFFDYYDNSISYSISEELSTGIIIITPLSNSF